ncbi:MAG: universal stress protein, partial [Alphaproteobacteria bacterium]
ILVVPPDARASLAHRVVVGWNGSVAAARAVAAAMPFLAAADAVTVLTTREGAEPRAAANDLALHLAWHGVGASAQTFETGGLSVGQALLAEAQDLGCDLLVIGGYGHGRMRELILGGVTRHLLAAAAMPMFVAN